MSAPVPDIALLGLMSKCSTPLTLLSCVCVDLMDIFTTLQDKVDKDLHTQKDEFFSGLKGALFIHCPNYKVADPLLYLYALDPSFSSSLLKHMPPSSVSERTKSTALHARQTQAR